MDEAFGNWLAGFIDGEGCFLIRRQRGGHAPAFKLTLRDDDAAILQQVQAATGLGRVRRGKPSGDRGNPQAIWDVDNKADCVALVDLLDRYPLRAKKARDFGVWREAVHLWAAHDRRGRGAGREADHFALAALKADLESVRAYKEVA